MGYSFTELGSEGCRRSLNALLFWLYPGKINSMGLSLIYILPWPTLCIIATKYHLIQRRYIQIKPHPKTLNRIFVTMKVLGKINYLKLSAASLFLDRREYIGVWLKASVHKATICLAEWIANQTNFQTTQYWRDQTTNFDHSLDVQGCRVW